MIFLLITLALVLSPALQGAETPGLPAATESDQRLHADGQGWRLDKAKITDPARPRVLLVGDSILNGYQRAAIGALDGQAYVDTWVNPYHQSEHLNRLLAQVLDQGPYDVVHFNMGLHGWQEGRIQPGTFEPLTKAYVEIIRTKLPKAKIVWASSTPVTVKGKPTELDPVINPIIVEHNRMAAKVMAEQNVPVNDFYALLADKLDLARGDQFHWSAPAYELLAKAVVESVQPSGKLDPAADLELSETISLAECHSIGWVRANTQPANQRSWDWQLDAVQWRQAVQEKGEGPKEDCTLDLWVPGGIEYVQGVVVISGHGSGQTLYKHPDLRKIARELRLAIFKFVGNPMQRGFWPKSLLYDQLRTFGQKSQHPELEHAPLFLYGHSNGTGFSAIFPATEHAHVWGWVSMRPGITAQVYQPGAATVPGMIMFGENDPFFAKPSQQENMAVVEKMRKDHAALWHFAVEPGTGHGPGEKSWPLVFSFLRHSWAARVPADCDPRQGPVTLLKLEPEHGYLGRNWDAAQGGYQTLPVAPQADFPEDKTTASWLLNAAYAADWQRFQREGQVRP
jgi:lysophospholipase L1-like esterase